MTTCTLKSQTSESLTDDVVLNRYMNHVEPFWNSNITFGEFEGVKGVPIHYAYALNDNAKGAIVLSSGRIESLVKYKELVYNLYHAGYSVFVHDHRGQGLSGRMTANLHQGYVEDFDDYVDDTKHFYDEVVTANTDFIPLLLCHSMGSAIGALYCLKYPDDFSKVAFSAPMFGIRPALPDWFATGLIKTHMIVNALFSKKTWYFWGQQDYVEEPFEQNPLTHCSTRYQIFRDEYRTHKQAQLGGVTGRWLWAAHNALAKIKRNAKHFPLPALVLQASNDTIVDNQRQSLIVSNMPDCKFVEIINAKHELLMESDRYRDQALRQILAFFSA